MLSENTQLNNHRSGSFKRTVTTSDGRRRRDETTIQIRKQKKEEALKKKRSLDLFIDENKEMMPVSSVFQNRKVTINDLPQLCQVISSDRYTINDKVEATRQLRRLISKERNPPVEKVVASGVLNHLVRNLELNQRSGDLALEIMMILSKVASTNANYIVEAQAIRPLVDHLCHPTLLIKDQAMICLGNVAGEGVAMRDLVLSHNPVPTLIDTLSTRSSRYFRTILLGMDNKEQATQISLVQNCAWLISNLSRGRPSPDRSITDRFVYSLASMMDNLLSLPQSQGSLNALNDFLWAFVYLSDGDESKVEHVMGTGITSKLIQMIKMNNRSIGIHPIIRIIMNFVSNDSHIEAVIEAGFLDCVPDLLGSPSTTIRKDTCWILSNICSGTYKQADRVLKNKEISDMLFNCAINDI